MFTVQRVKTGYRFNLKAGNGQIVASSPVWLTMEACVKAIGKVRACAGSPIEDQTGSTRIVCSLPKYVIYRNEKQLICFYLLDQDGEIIIGGEDYTAKRSCKNGICSVEKNAPDAQILT